MYVIKSITEGFQDVGLHAGQLATIIEFGNPGKIKSMDEILEKCEGAYIVLLKGSDGLDPFDFDIGALVENLRDMDENILIIAETDGNHNTLKFSGESIWITCVPKNDRIKGLCVCDEIVRYIYSEKEIPEDTKAPVWLVPRGPIALRKCMNFMHQHPEGYQLTVNLSEVMR